MPKCKLLIIIGLGMAVEGSTSLALQTYPLHDHQSTTITISQTEPNRISVANDRIQQVFGAEGGFDVQSDEEGGQIFLKVASESYLEAHPSKPSTITIITESGLTQDLRLIPKELEFQSILFKPQVIAQEDKQKQSGSCSQIQPIIHLMKAMVRNETLEGYTKASLDQNTVSSMAKDRLRDLSLTPLLHYLGEQLEGKVYTLTNQGKIPLHLKEQDFSLQGDVAIVLPRMLLHPKETTTLYVVSRPALDHRVKPKTEIRGLVPDLQIKHVNAAVGGVQ